MDVKVDTQDCGLGEDVADLRFELGLGVKISATEAYIRCLNYQQTTKRI
jgi:hypothetical protein